MKSPWAKNKDRYKNRLQAELDSFDLERAELLSISIHDAEADGYDISPEEDVLWEELTARIQEHYYER